MIDSNPNISVIILYVYRANTPIEKKELSHQHITPPSTKEKLYYTHRIHIKHKHTEKLKVKEWEQIYHAHNENKSFYTDNYTIVLRQRKI